MVSCREMFCEIICHIFESWCPFYSVSGRNAPNCMTSMWSNWLLDYLATHPNAKIRYWQSDMRLLIHSDALFLVEWDAKINYGGYFYLGWNHNDDEPQKINGAVNVSSSLLHLFAVSVAERELGGTFYNPKKGKILRLTLEEMGWKQGPTTIFVDNNTASGICNSTIKRQRSRAMNGQYFWLIDQVNLNKYRIKWAPGLEKMADYFTKHFAAAQHRNVRPFYVHMHNSLQVIQKVNKKVSDKKVSALLRGCVNIPTIPVAQTRAPLFW